MFFFCHINISFNFLFKELPGLSEESILIRKRDIIYDNIRNLYLCNFYNRSALFPSNINNDNGSNKIILRFYTPYRNTEKTQFFSYRLSYFIIIQMICMWIGMHLKRSVIIKDCTLIYWFFYTILSSRYLIPPI